MTPELLELLIQVSDLLDDYQDVNDGPNGQSVPNRAMSLKCDVDEAIEREERTRRAIQSRPPCPTVEEAPLMAGMYVLDANRVPQPCEDLLVWARWFEKADRQVAHEEVGPDAAVSTVFLGLDDNFGFGDQPVLFETMVFGGPLDGEQGRYSTWEEAEKGHAVMVARVREAK